MERAGFEQDRDAGGGRYPGLAAAAADPLPVGGAVQAADALGVDVYVNTVTDPVQVQQILSDNCKSVDSPKWEFWWTNRHWTSYTQSQCDVAQHLLCFERLPEG